MLFASGSVSVMRFPELGAPRAEGFIGSSDPAARRYAIASGAAQMLGPAEPSGACRRRKLLLATGRVIADPRTPGLPAFLRNARRRPGSNLADRHLRRGRNPVAQPPVDGSEAAQ